MTQLLNWLLKRFELLNKERVYLGAAVALVLVGSVGFLVSMGAFALRIGGSLSTAPNDWGVFGDFIGGFTGSVIGLLTLIALALTLHLQARELQDTRKELKNQARSARYNIELTKRIESRKMKPILKVEWFDKGNRTLELAVTNVGLGPAIITIVSVGFQDREDFAFAYRQATSNFWKQMVGSVLPVPEYLCDVREQEFGDPTRAIGAGEHQWIATVRVKRENPDMERARTLLNNAIRINLTFLALDGKEWTMESQLDIPPWDAGINVDDESS